MIGVKSLPFVCFAVLACIVFPAILPYGFAATNHAFEQNCGQLLAAPTRTSLSGSHAAEKLLILIRIALTSGAEWERELPAHLKAAMESPSPVNPFLNLKSFQAQALAQRADPFLDAIQDSEWSWIQDQVRAVFDANGAEVVHRQSDSIRTAEIGRFEFIPDSELAKALDRGDAFSGVTNTKKYIGNVNGHHLFVVDQLARTYHGLVAVSWPQGAAQPSIKWLIPVPMASSGVRAEWERELASVPMWNIWVLGGKLYVKSDFYERKERSPVLLQIDVVSGEITKRIRVPEKGRFKMWHLGNGQIVALKYKRRFPILGEHVARDFYRFDPSQERFVPTGLDIGFLGEPSVTKERGDPLLMIGSSGPFRTDGDRLYVSTDSNALQKVGRESTMGWGFHSGWWDHQHMVARILSDTSGLSLSLKIFTDDRETTREQVRRGIFPPAVPPHELKILLPNTFGTPHEIKIRVAPLPGTGMNIVEVTGAKPPQYGWLVNRNTLEFVALKMPKDYSAVVDAKTGLWRKGLELRHKSTPEGQHVLVMVDPAVRSGVSWKLDTQSLTFEEPKVFQMPIEESSSSLVFSEDIQSVLIQFSKDGIWLARKFQMQRQGAE